jgi:hypothetical protein
MKPFSVPAFTMISRWPLEVGAMYPWGVPSDHAVFVVWELWMYVSSLYTIARPSRRNLVIARKNATRALLTFNKNAPVISYFPPTKSECLEYLQHTGRLSFVSSNFPQLHQHSFNCWYPFLMYVEFVYYSTYHTHIKIVKVFTRSGPRFGVLY